MKKLILLGLMTFSISSFAQTSVKNGTIYKEHPYITLVKQMTALFPKGDTVAIAKFYADSVKFYDPSEPKAYNLTKAKEGWNHIFSNWEQISIKQIGYPDGLEYSTDPFTVQSWWLISAVNKKTKKSASFHQVVFDMFNKDGKIAVELCYYDTAPLIAAMK